LRLTNSGAPAARSCPSARFCLLPQELLELRADRVGEDDLLRRRILARALEHTQLDVPLRPVRVVENVANVEREDLVLAQAGAEGEAHNDVIPPARGVLAGDAQDERDLALGEGARRARERVGVGGHAVMHASSTARSKGKRP
jgi:hypothetical protein